MIRVQFLKFFWKIITFFQISKSNKKNKTTILICTETEGRFLPYFLCSLLYNENNIVFVDFNHKYIPYFFRLFPVRILLHQLRVGSIPSHCDIIVSDKRNPICLDSNVSGKKFIKLDYNFFDKNKDGVFMPYFFHPAFYSYRKTSLFISENNSIRPIRLFFGSSHLRV